MCWSATQARAIWARQARKPRSAIASLIECRLETGRTHQIRVHLAHIGHPLLGDPVYGPGFRTKAAQLPPKAREALEGLGRQALHAYLLSIQHPTTGRQLEFRSELPVDLARLRVSLAAYRRAFDQPKKAFPAKGLRVRQGAPGVTRV